LAKWHKIKKAQQAKQAGQDGISPRQMKRMMRGKGMPKGMNIEEWPDVEKIVFHFPDRELTIIPENVTKMVMPQGDVYQILGKSEVAGPEESVDEGVEEPTTTEISPMDAQLVSQQAGVSIEEATEALKAADGNIARAIIQLKQSLG
jgi:nascent polypeptide-associated complex subunit alpha